MARENLCRSKKLIAHIVIFFAFWSIYAVFIAPYVKGQNNLLFNLISPIIKLLVWTAPVLIILSREKKDIVSCLKLYKNSDNCIRWSIISGIAIVGYNLLVSHLFYQDFFFNPFFAWHKWLGGVILVGFTEEVLFRGYFLQRLITCFPFWMANVITSVLFLLIHFPGWYAHSAQMAQGVFEWLLLMAFIFGFSLAEGWSLRKSNSLWPCIIMHSLNNFMSYAVVTAASR
ncbi:MAG: type II CAAX endopeptidase family protein [Sporomusaceae bacterium]|nr:type II CAAX endopeptidase family protein [Sporomusaceae bacterium]